LGGNQIVYFLIKEMVALDGKLSNRYFSLNTLKYKIENRGPHTEIYYCMGLNHLYAACV
jgi:hypothetical protein